MWTCTPTANNWNHEVNIGNWTERSQFGLKSYAWFQNWTSAQREFDLKSQVWFQTKIARPEVQLPLYKIRLEIARFNSLHCKYKNYKILVSTNICWTKLPNLPNNGFFVFHFPAMWLVSLKKPWLFCYTIPFSLAEKKMRFRTKDSAIRE